jgi:hypothetical protein
MSIMSKIPLRCERELERISEQSVLVNAEKWKILYMYKGVALYSKCDIIVVSKGIFCDKFKEEG